MRFQNDWRRRLAASEDEKQSLRDSVAKLDNANKTLDLKLKHARTQLDSEIRKRKVAEQDMQRLVGFLDSNHTCSICVMTNVFFGLENLFLFLLHLQCIMCVND